MELKITKGSFFIHFGGGFTDDVEDFTVELLKVGSY